MYKGFNYKKEAGIRYDIYKENKFTEMGTNNWDMKHECYWGVARSDFRKKAYKYLQRLTKEVKVNLGKAPTEKYMFELFKELTGFPEAETKKFVNIILEEKVEDKFRYDKG